MNTSVFTCQQARQIDMVGYLASLGYEPRKIRGNDYWYVSPFRNESEPSFKVNRHANVWYDHGTGNGGNLVDFGILFHQCPISELLKILSGQLPLQNHDAPLSGNRDLVKRSLHVLNAKPIQAWRLMVYLQQRRIPLEIADKYCREVEFEIRDKRYTAIGFQNRVGGYELRNEFFKGSSSPKDLTLVNNGARILTVFEGFFDFLSYETIHRNQPQPLTNFLILNTLAYFEKAVQIMDNYAAVHLFLDRDDAGRKKTDDARSLHMRYKDCSDLYHHYKDLNEWLMHPGHEQKPLKRSPDP